MRTKHTPIIIIILLFTIIPHSNLIARQLDNEQMAVEQHVAEKPETINDNNLFKKVERWYEHNINYATIAGLMVVESSFIPFPSEIVIPPAAYIASKPESNLNIFLVVLFGTIGALIGAYINYFLALFLGRPIIYGVADSKFGKMMLLSGEKVERAENYFNKHGVATTFFGRLIPVIRQLISIPAGLSRMNFLLFSIYTFIGAGIWNIILALLGYAAHGQADLINKYSSELSTIIKITVAALVLFLIVRYLIRKQRKKSTTNSNQGNLNE